MIPMIQQALTMGYTAAQVLKYVSSKFKSAAPGISSAKKQGYSDEDILKFLGNKIKPTNQKKVDEQLSAQEKYLKVSGIKTKEERKETRDKFIGSAIGAAGTAWGAYNLYKNYEDAIKGIGKTFGFGGTAGQPESQTNVPTPGDQINPDIEQQQTPGQLASPETPMPGPQIAQQLGKQVQKPISNAMQTTTPKEIGQAAQAIPSQKEQSLFKKLMENVDISTLKPSQIEKLKFLNTVSDQLQAKGKGLNDPEYQNLAKTIQETISGKLGLADQELNRFQKGYPQDKMQMDDFEINKPEKIVMPEANKKSEQQMIKGSSIITPNGEFATIEDIPGKAAKVNVNGKQQVYNADDLTPIPENHEEIGQLYQKLIDKIPEGQKSRVYDAIGYDPNRNAIKYTYHDGKTYIIDDVPEEIAREIANSGFMAKTSGGNYMGFYYKGNPSIGAGMHILIDDLQKLRGGKGKEYSYKFEELYSQHRLPKNILKEKSEREKLREREEKKAKKKRSFT